MGDSSVFLPCRSRAPNPSDNPASRRSRESGQCLVGLSAAQHRIAARGRQARVRALKRLRKKPEYKAATEDAQAEQRQAELETLHQTYAQQAQDAETEYTEIMSQAGNPVDAIPAEVIGDEQDALEAAGRAVYEAMMERWFTEILDDDDEEVCLPPIGA
jgi:hypothetical protein